MKYYAYFLKFNSPLHIGDHKPESYETSESIIRSDTIVAALISSWAKLGKFEWIGDGNLPFTISSAFPFFYQENKKITLFPRIKRPFPIVLKDQKHNKALKKIAWLDQFFFEKMAKYEDFSDFDPIVNIQGEILAKSPIPDNFMYRQVSERVKIPRDRTEQKSKPFYMERLYFTNAGLYFMVEGDKLGRLEEGLNLLQNEGFGTDRNVGNGFFEWEKDEISFELDLASDYRTNLGLYCPESKELLESQIDENTAYELVKRGGWITTQGYQTLEKNSVYMFAEGSVFKSKSSINGNPNLDLTPDNYPMGDHKVFRCGRTIFVPIKI